MVAGFQYAPHGDLAAVEKLIDDKTGGIMVEPILGEGGVVPAPPGFLQGLRKICDERDLLLVFDEVQCGCGRTGKWFGYQNFGVVPDVMTLAKSLCAGIAGGAMLTTVELAKHLRPGMHASTFGGNPIASAAGIAAIKMIEEEGLLDHVDKVAAVFRDRLEALAEECDAITDVRVFGMMIGVQLSFDGAAVVKNCLDRRLLINCTQGNVIRLLPAMNITVAEVEEGCDRLAAAIKDVAAVVASSEVAAAAANPDVAQQQHVQAQ
jgi:acetylornithine/succinyldiaminopimelate/putrescine aminotransferase